MSVKVKRKRPRRDFPIDDYGRFAVLKHIRGRENDPEHLHALAVVYETWASQLRTFASASDPLSDSEMN